MWMSSEGEGLIKRNREMGQYDAACKQLKHC